MDFPDVVPTDAPSDSITSWPTLEESSLATGSQSSEFSEFRKYFPDPTPTEKPKYYEPLCQEELYEANSCVTGNVLECSPCFDPNSFVAKFPLRTEQHFMSALAFENPARESDAFCIEANWRVCQAFYPEGNGESVSFIMLCITVQQPHQ